MFTKRQTQIIEASINIIAELGIQGLTIKNLSKAIGISEPGIYRHFDSKTDILIAILDNFKNNSTEFIKKLKNSKENSITKINNIFINHFNLFSNNPAFVSVIFAEEIFKNEKILTKKIIGILQANENLISSIIETGQKNNEIRTDIDVKYLTVIIMGSLRLIVKKWELSNYSFNLKKEGTKVFESINKLIIKL